MRYTLTLSTLRNARICLYLYSTGQCGFFQYI